MKINIEILDELLEIEKKLIKYILDNKTDTFRASSIANFLNVEVDNLESILISSMEKTVVLEDENELNIEKRKWKMFPIIRTVEFSQNDIIIIKISDDFKQFLAEEVTGNNNI